MEKNLGHATAYGYAKSKGYTGTEEEFGVLMASYASVAQDASQSANSAAESAQLASNEAQRASQSATSAHNDAETASNIKTDVESARDTTVDAKNATVEAKNISVEAKNSAISAKDTAESKAQIAEAWAVGQKDGTDVPSTDETYHNNAKYYSEQADIAKIGAESAQQLAQASATSASESASDASTSAQTASQAAQTATSKASEATTAATTATTKASEASTSAGTASTAAQTATNKAFEATTAATTATTKASEASQSATSASTAKINAETARDAAAQSASEAANSAIEAAQSAQSVDAERLNRVAFGSYVTESVSGSIASFTDGADNIPMKDVLVHIEPVQAGSGDPSPDNVRPITGWTGTKVTRTGKNLWTFNDSYSPTAYKTLLNRVPFYLKAGTYTFSAIPNIESDSVALYGYHADGTRTKLGRLSASASKRSATNTISKDVVSLYFVSNQGGTISDIQLELGSTATAYEPYSGQTYDITFPTEAGTVYGGTLDVTKGELVVDRAIMTLDGTRALNPNGKTSASSRFGLNVAGKAVGERNILSNMFYTTPIFVDDVGWVYGRVASNYVEFSLPPDIEQTTAAGKAWFAENPTQLCYELATPITYQLTPQEITSLLGANNLWADTGDSEVEYRVDPALLLDDELSEVQSMIAGVESSTVATKNYSIGDLVIVGDTLYEVTAAIASGETISASNTVATTVENVIKSRMTTVDNTIRNRIADSIDDTLMISGKAADAKTVGDEIDSLKSDLNGGTVYNFSDGYGLDANGNVITAHGKSVSEFIPIADINEGQNRFYGGNIATPGDYYVAFYDVAHSFISALQLLSGNTEYRTINWTTQVTAGTPAYVRFSFQSGYEAKITNNVNTGQIVYWSAESTTSEGLVTEVNGLQNEVDQIRENIPEEGQIDVIETAINGKSEQNYTEGYGLNADGTLYENSEQSVSDKVPYTWTGTTRFTYGEISADYRICFYDENDTVLLTYISNSNSQYRNVSTDSLETTPSYVRFSFKKDFAGTLSENSNEESRITYYRAEETITQGLVEKVSDIQTTMLTDYGLNVSVSADTLTDGTTLEVAENIDNRKNDVIEFHAEIDSFTSLAVGHGYMISHGSWIVIDSTNVTVYADETTAQVAQYQHGLTFAHYINVLIKRGNEGKATIEITTGGSDLVYTQDNVTFFGSRGSVFAFCTGILNKVKLSAVFKDFNEPIVIFGDSYQSIGSTARWPYYMIANGYTRYMLSGFPGANAGHERLAFREIIKHIKPKYIVWCLGMNGSDSASEINASWKNSVDEIVTYCEQNNVTPIFATIPNVPERIQTYKNAYVKSLGYRYIDFAKAVGAESQGSTWYTGMLSNDNLHPSSLGAKALYAQVLADFPEIMR